jgi:hypothetical protein
MVYLVLYILNKTMKIFKQIVWLSVKYYLFNPKNLVYVYKLYK